MAMNRIPFQAGLSLNQFLSHYKTDEQCEVRLKKLAGHTFYLSPLSKQEPLHSLAWSGQNISM